MSGVTWGKVLHESYLLQNRAARVMNGLDYNTSDDQNQHGFAFNLNFLARARIYESSLRGKQGTTGSP